MKGSDESEAERLSQWLRGIRDFADRAMPHATGQGDLALLTIRSSAQAALNGESETASRLRDFSGTERKSS